MPTQRSYLVLWTALVIAATLAALAVIHGFDREGLTLLLRASARMSFAMFILWLSLPALAVLTPPRMTSVPPAEPHLLMSFAVAHTIHVAVIFFSAFQGYFAQITERELLTVVIGGGSAYLMIVLMGVTALRPPARWRTILRGVGTTYVWLVFMNSYVTRVREGSALNVLGIAALVIAAALQLAAWRARRAELSARTASA